MRLNPLKKADWLWILGIFLFYIILMLTCTPIMNNLAQTPFFSPPDFFPAEINPNKASTPGYMMDYKLSGEYWIIVAYFVGWLFNIFGEEFLWRGIIFPRHIKKYGSKAWIYHGILWGLWHFYWKWELFMLVPFALFLSYAVYKCKNTWVGIISHGALNLVPFIMLTVGVLS
jgi:membrane protease YdiL (CAAX protease family)